MKSVRSNGSMGKPTDWGRRPHLTQYLLQMIGEAEEYYSIIGYFTVHRIVGYMLSGGPTVTVGVSCELLRDEREGPWPMAWHFPL